MKEKKQRLLLICMEVVALGIIIPAVYWLTLKLLYVPFTISYPEDGWTYTLVSFVLILGFDVGWIVLMCMWSQGNIHVKIVLTLLVLAISAAILSCFLIVYALEGAFQ